MDHETENVAVPVIRDLRDILKAAYHDGLTKWKPVDGTAAVYRKQLADWVVNATAPEAPRPDDDTLFVERLKVLAKEVRAAVEANWHPVSERTREDKAYLLQKMSEHIEAADRHLAWEGEIAPAGMTR